MKIGHDLAEKKFVPGSGVGVGLGVGVGVFSKFKERFKPFKIGNKLKNLETEATTKHKTFITIMTHSLHWLCLKLRARIVYQKGKLTIQGFIQLI